MSVCKLGSLALLGDTEWHLKDMQCTCNAAKMRRRREITPRQGLKVALLVSCRVKRFLRIDTGLVLHDHSTALILFVPSGFLHEV
jgi:hypothetical protein